MESHRDNNALPEDDEGDGDDEPHKADEETLDLRHIVLISWTGLRGAVGMALAMSLITDDKVDSTLSGPIMLMTAGLVICTLIINGISTQALVAKMGLSDISEERKVCAMTSAC